MKYSIIILLALFSCSSPQELKTYEATNSNFFYSGRIDSTPEKGMHLITSASFVEAQFEGDSCSFTLQATNAPFKYSYASIEVDSTYIERIKVLSDSMQTFSYKTEKNKTNKHTIRIFNAAEPALGYITIGSFTCNNLLSPRTNKKTNIEFIGNSITCSMGIDQSTIKCMEGNWFDQHNAYFSYAKTTSESLNANFILTSVSGIGIKSNWNGIGAVMPKVYENTYLDTIAGKKWDFDTYNPDIVCICLGTNDMSKGDGINEKQPFDSSTFIPAYSAFLETIYSHYPTAKIALLTSPMLKDNDNTLLYNCLKSISKQFKEKTISIFRFNNITPKGCDYHPGMNDHIEMKNQLKPFLDSLISTL